MRKWTIALALALALMLPAALAEGLEVEMQESITSELIDAPVDEAECFLGGEEPAGEAEAAAEAVASVQVGDFILDGTVLKYYKGNGGDVVVPDGVTEIAGHAFDHNHSYVSSKSNEITSIKLPDSLVRIDDFGISYCGNTYGFTINLPDSLTSIGADAFVYSGVTGVVIPKGVSTIQNWTFRYCDKLTTVTLPDGLVSIGQEAFEKCTSLTSVTIPGGVASLGNSAFVDCTALRSVTLKEGVQQIGQSAFSGCTLLSELSLPKSLVQIGASAFNNCASLSAVKLPEGMKTIQGSAFRDCVNLAHVDFPETLTTIGGYAFYGCNVLTGRESDGRMVLPDSVTTVGTYAFYNNTRMTDLVIGEGVTKLDNYTFAKCGQLSRVTINAHGSIGGAGNFDGINLNASFDVFCDLSMIDGLRDKGYTVNVRHVEEVADKAVKATCTEDGRTAGSHCAVCGEWIIEPTVVPAKGHKVVKDKAVAPTWTKAGKTEGSHCSRCKEVLVAQEKVPKLTGKVTLNASGTQTLELGKTLKLTATVKPGKYKKEITWKSSNTKVATVTGAGKVKAVSKGTATISAKLPNGKGTSVKVKVVAPKPTKVKIVDAEGTAQSEATLKVGKKLKVWAKLTPAKAEGKLTWTSANKSIATVSGDGDKATITAKKAGKVKITVKASSKVKAVITITVKKK